MSNLSYIYREIGSGSWQEVYEGLLSTQVKLVKSFSLGTTIIGLSIQPVIINVSVITYARRHHTIVLLVQKYENISLRFSCVVCVSSPPPVDHVGDASDSAINTLTINHRANVLQLRRTRVP